MRLLTICLAVLITPVAAALINGHPDQDGRFPAVVAVILPDRSTCTATVIGERMLLTAAHCLVDRREGTLLAEFAEAGAEIRMRQAEGTPTITVTVEEALLAPPYRQALEDLEAYRRLNPGQPTRINYHFATRFADVAILRLRDPMPDADVLAVDLGPLEKGDDVTLAGWGCTRYAGRKGLGQARNWGRSQVLLVEPVNFYTDGGLQNEAVSACPGDSGAPVLREGRVVGVTAVAYELYAARGSKSNMAASLHTLRDWPLLQQLARAQTTAESERR